MAIFKKAEDNFQPRDESQLTLPGMGLEVPEDFKILKDYINWDRLSYSEPLSDDFVERYYKYFRDKNLLENIAKYAKLSPEFVREHPADEFIRNVSLFKFPKEFVDEIFSKYPEKFNWLLHSSFLSKNGLLNFNWIKQHKDKNLDWREISENIELSDEVADFLWHEAPSHKAKYLIYNPSYEANVSEGWKNDHAKSISYFEYEHRW
jgi:hypothetical protein